MTESYDTIREYVGTVASIEFKRHEWRFFMPGFLSPPSGLFYYPPSAGAARTHNDRPGTDNRAGGGFMETWLIITLIAMGIVVMLMAKL